MRRENRTAQAASTTWGTPAVISGSNDVASNGTAVLTYNWNTYAGPVNGVTFSNLLPANLVITSAGQGTSRPPLSTNLSRRLEAAT